MQEITNNIMSSNRIKRSSKPRLLERLNGNWRISRRRGRGQCGNRPVGADELIEGRSDVQVLGADTARHLYEEHDRTAEHDLLKVMKNRVLFPNARRCSS